VVIRSALGSYTDHPQHGPLPAILLLMTVGTGMVDAVSILALGRVFVANMTGNIVFIGFALAGAPGFSLWGSVIALVAFLVGASVGGLLVARSTAHRGKLLRSALALQVVLAALALAAALVPLRAVAPGIVLAALALALGIQNAVVRHLAVPDMTTTVLTMTLTGFAADLRKRDLPTAARRSAAVVCMLVGALLGALLVVHVGTGAGLAAVLLVSAAALLCAAAAARDDRAWTGAQH
jgi:uncharacterized membrane protein YoaK (UPF0700 family)